MWKLNPFFCSAETLKEIVDKLFDEGEYKEVNKYYKMLIRKYPESESAKLADLYIVTAKNQGGE